MTNYLFDVDGTLTPSRGTIDTYSGFKKWFTKFASVNNVVLVTGSDRPKTVEQLGETIYRTCKRVYNCSGNDVYEQDKQIKFNDWKLPMDSLLWLQSKLDHSPFETKTGKHFEHRTGMCNFSVVGRNANPKERKEYYEYDCETKERETIAKEFKEKFPEIQADVGGETGLDIFPVGYDKGQVVKDYDIDTIKFFGDRCDPQGNDYAIAKLLKPHQVFHVKDWEHCWELLLNDKISSI